MNKRKFVVILLMIFFIISNTFGEDKWQKGKKYSEICSPSDSMIYKIHNGYHRKDNYYLFRGRKYYSLYPLLNNIKESDPAIPNSLISAYKINRNASFVFSLIAAVSFGSFIGSIYWGLGMEAVSGVRDSSSERWFAYSFLSLIGSVGIGLVCEGKKSGLANDISDHYNGYISGLNKNIGLKLNYKF
ncbi:hypothetical protein DRP43_01340 [candidate division TA06 bacterium]|uniref:Uncharacterized protein n=1 Tax=candidate division TA06 bacterium TaxID=2250710 RepID=A0A660SP18_UNCT6|nr:MAG: hypothetical protein DRP43_01340 [candidate division TA06 bacterium]